MENEIKDPQRVVLGDITVCKSEIAAVMDALYVLSSKWRMYIIVALTDGNKRFGEIQKLVNNITSKVLAQELKDMEQHGFLIRKTYDPTSIRVEYELTEYSKSIKPSVNALRDFGLQHRDKIRNEMNIKELNKKSAINP